MTSAHPRRTAAAIAGIIACALAAIIVTAVIVVPSSGEDAAPSTAGSVATPPPLKPMLLSLAEATALAGSPLRVTIEGDSLGQPAGPDFAVDPAACTSVAFIAQAVTYRNVAWEVARNTQYAFAGVIVSQSVVLTASEDLASSFLKEQRDAWQKCLGVTYRFGTFSANQYRAINVDTGDGRISATTQADEAGAGACGHVMAVKKAYVVEAVTCGWPPYDTNALADMILKRVPG